MLIGQSRKSGFTLVELSIVLVIIGLLIGGILIGQSLIDSTKFQKIIRDLQQYEVAAVQFYSRFNQIPGDSNLFSYKGNNDGDNIGDSFPGLPNGGGCNASEEAQTWGHLGESGMLPFVPYENCTGGAHNAGDYDDEVYAGVLWPYIELNAAHDHSYGNKKAPIYFTTWATGKSGFKSLMNPLDYLALEAKFGFQPYSSNNVETGFVNYTAFWAYGGGEGYCFANGDTVALCTDETAVVGSFVYYFDIK